VSASASVPPQRVRELQGGHPHGSQLPQHRHV
jgi:hypothetical protein